MMAALADGRWVEPQRVRVVALMSLFATIAMTAYLFTTAHGTLDNLGRPLGTDFSDVWAAGRMAIEGRAPLAWDWPAHYAAQQAAHHRQDIPFYGWHYPPPFLLVATLLAMMRYVTALVIWQGVTLAMALNIVRAIVPGRLAMLAALGCPVVLVCLGHGHNGFLTAATSGRWSGAARSSARCLPALLLGCMIYKPQFGLVIPVVLIVGGHWRAVIARLAGGDAAGRADVPVLGSAGLGRVHALAAFNADGWLSSRARAAGKRYRAPFRQCATGGRAYRLRGVMQTAVSGLAVLATAFVQPCSAAAPCPQRARYRSHACFDSLCSRL